MPVLRFPDPETASPEGIVALGGDLQVETLRLAYRQGIFPWPHEGYPLLWFSPDPRAILDFEELHIPERLVRLRRKTPWTFSVDGAFETVIAACRQTRRAGQRGTWITPAMERAYVALHHAGDAHSVEAWDAGGNLVGGLYGVTAAGVFSGESMFHRLDNASKLCVLHLIDHLAERGADWIDIQTITPHFEQFGAREIPRADFLRRLKNARERNRTLFGP